MYLEKYCDLSMLHAVKLKLTNSKKKKKHPLYAGSKHFKYIIKSRLKEVDENITNILMAVNAHIEKCLVI